MTALMKGCFFVCSLKKSQMTSMAEDERPIEEGCACPACARHTRAYLRHLIISGEILGMVLCTLHNIHFYQELMRRVRGAIEEGRFGEWADEVLPGLSQKRAT